MLTIAFHPVADIFPLMQGEEFSQLVSDIKEHGLREPIWLYQEKIIDGRNRYRACQEAEVEPAFREWDGEGSLIAFVVSLNLHRRHLDESQRGMVAARIENLKHGGNRKNQDANLHLEDISRREAAELANVSTRTVASAARVVEKGSAGLVAAVDAGKVSVSTAAPLTELDKAEQDRLAIGKQIEAMLGERRGRPGKENQENFPELKGKQNRDIAAERAEFGNARTYQQAKKVIDKGSPGLVAAVDAGKMRVSTGATLTTLDKAEQARISLDARTASLFFSPAIRAQEAEARRVVRLKKHAALTATQLDGTARYSLIYADPPWQYDYAETENRAIENQYPTMTLDESQRAMVAARIADMRQGERTDLSPFGERFSQGTAADLLNVGKRSVERATQVVEKGSAGLVAAVATAAAVEAGISRTQQAAHHTTGDVLPRGGDQKSEERGSMLDSSIDLPQRERAKQNGVSRFTQQRLDWLARNDPDRLEQVKAGQRSVNRACIEAGHIWLHPRARVRSVPVRYYRRQGEH